MMKRKKMVMNSILSEKENKKLLKKDLTTTGLHDIIKSEKRKGSLKAKVKKHDKGKIHNKKYHCKV